MEADKNGCQCQPKDHHTDADQVYLQQEVVVVGAQGQKDVVNTARTHAEKDGEATTQLDPEGLRCFKLCVATTTQQEHNCLQDHVDGGQGVRVDTACLVMHLADRLKAHSSCHVLMGAIPDVYKVSFNIEQLFESLQLLQSVDSSVFRDQSFQLLFSSLLFSTWLFEILNTAIITFIFRVIVPCVLQLVLNCDNVAVSQSLFCRGRFEHAFTAVRGQFLGLRRAPDPHHVSHFSHEMALLALFTPCLITLLTVKSITDLRELSSQLNPLIQLLNIFHLWRHNPSVFIL